jgi:hypothetical protein
MSRLLKIMVMLAFQVGTFLFLFGWPLGRPDLDGTLLALLWLLGPVAFGISGWLLTLPTWERLSVA